MFTSPRTGIAICIDKTLYIKRKDEEVIVVFDDGNKTSDKIKDEFWKMLLEDLKGTKFQELAYGHDIIINMDKIIFLSTRLEGINVTFVGGHIHVFRCENHLQVSADIMKYMVNRHRESVVEKNSLKEKMSVFEDLLKALVYAPGGPEATKAAKDFSCLGSTYTKSSPRKKSSKSSKAEKSTKSSDDEKSTKSTSVCKN
jgi:hypothetical protein